MLPTDLIDVIMEFRKSFHAEVSMLIYEIVNERMEPYRILWDDEEKSERQRIYPWINSVDAFAKCDHCWAIDVDKSIRKPTEDILEEVNDKCGDWISICTSFTENHPLPKVLSRDASNFAEALEAWNQYKQWIDEWKKYPPLVAKEEYLKQVMSRNTQRNCHLCGLIDGLFDYFSVTLRWLNNEGLSVEEQQFLESQIDGEKQAITIRGFKWFVIRKWRIYVSVLDGKKWIPCDGASLWEGRWKGYLKETKVNPWALSQDEEWPLKLMNILNQYEDDDLVVVVDYHF